MITLNKGYARKDQQGQKVYPNPAKDYIVFDVNGIQKDALLIVYDILGQVVAETSLTQTVTTLDTKTWSSGLYVWRMLGKEKTYGNGKVQIMKW